MNRVFNVLIILFSLFNLSTYGQKKIEHDAEWIIRSSEIKFKIKNAGFIVEGSFTGLSGRINFDVTKGFGNSIEVSTDAKSVNSNNTARDNHLKESDYFDVKNYPYISLKSSLFSKQKDGSFIGYFKLTIKGKSKDVIIPFTFNEKDQVGIFTGNLQINRLDFGIGESSIILSDKVIISITVLVNEK